jgi:AAA domain, putative AbiEii toxin, Type IV TA system
MRVSLTDFRAFASTGLLEVKPLTFLVGENSSGKTSFLAALGYLWRLQERMFSASFNLPPFDLGTFDEIVHRVRGRTRPDDFRLEIENHINVEPRRSPLFYSRGAIGKSSGLACLRLTFTNNVGDAVIKNLELIYKDYKLEIRLAERIRVIVSVEEKLVFDSKEGQEELKLPGRIGRLENFDISDMLFYLRRIVRDRAQSAEESVTVSDEALSITAVALEQLTQTFPRAIFASAPVRSNPSRVYTPTDQTRTPDGTHTPQALFKIKESDEGRWLRLKAGLEDFGRLSGMFSAINVARYRTSGSSPFQISVTRKGKQSNIVDVGYGVSQALPILTDLIESPTHSGFLFQQPEVHLHPQAQAALGSFFVDYLDSRRGATIIAETHSDYLIDRVRLCILNQKIRSSDVSILYFESEGTGTKVHQIQIDDQGNMIDTPKGYREFFVKEQLELLGIFDECA